MMGDLARRILGRRITLGTRNVIGDRAGGYERAPDLVDWTNVELTFTHDDVTTGMFALWPSMTYGSPEQMANARARVRNLLLAIFPRSHFEEEQ
jgi:hypothetical protein